MITMFVQFVQNMSSPAASRTIPQVFVPEQTQIKSPNHHQQPPKTHHLLQSPVRELTPKACYKWHKVLLLLLLPLFYVIIAVSCYNT